jgi:hypothetical protein
MRNLFKKANIPYFVIIFFGLLLFFMGIINHYFFRTVTFDYGNYNFAFRDYSHFRISPMPTYPNGGNFLQDHFSFTLIYFIPVFWLLNWLTGTYTLIIIQYSLVLIAAWYSFKIIQLRTDNLWLHTGVLAYYFLLLGRYTTFSCDANLAVISACFIPIFIYYFEIKKYQCASIIFILSLFSRENIPIWFIFIFVVLAIQHRKEKKDVLYSMAGIFISVVYFILLFRIFIPAVETEEKQFSLFNYSALGENPGEALSFILENPIETIKLFFINHSGDPAYDGVKAEFYLVYIVSGGFVLLLRPQYFIWFIPIVAQKMLNDSFIRWSISTYYSIEVVTLLPLSVFLVLSTLKSIKTQNIFAVITCLATLSMTIHKLDAVNVKIPWTMNPSKEKVYYKGFYSSPYKLKETHKLLKSIPGDARVSASDHLAPHLSQRESIYLFPDVKDAEYIVFSVYDNYFLLSHMENEKLRNEYLNSAAWKVIAKEFPVFLLKKTEKEMMTNNNFEIFKYDKDTLYCNYEKADTINHEVYFNDSTKATQIKKIVYNIRGSGNNCLLLDTQNPFGAFVEFKDAEKTEYIYATVRYLSTADRANIVVSCGSRFYYLNGKPNDEEPDGWKKLELGFWVPKHLDLNNLKVFLWNSGNEPAYFDDFQIIKYYRK